MFDLDSARLYLRRIKNVTMSIPCVSGPHIGVRCRLHLLKSSKCYRPLLAGLEECCCSTKTKNRNHKSHARGKNTASTATITQKAVARKPKYKCKTRCTPDSNLVSWFPVMEAVASFDGIADSDR